MKTSDTKSTSTLQNAISAYLNGEKALAEMTIAQLKDLCTHFGIGRSFKDKAALIAKVAAAAERAQAEQVISPANSALTERGLNDPQPAKLPSLSLLEKRLHELDENYRASRGQLIATMAEVVATLSMPA